ncbi:uncharacterized protein LOC130700480 isoform X2 [Daphnia carinata]|uniref:uncharacterized protein LOC130700480 isoform X2 n=1 Tax=Daphnia carinata TaxID=120202 RepID=UPI00257DA193|nr:uncharacterized protein LOC130700480 isoform X2 [Daphnia carinata]
MQKKRFLHSTSQYKRQRVTSYAFDIHTSTKIKPTPCYTTAGAVTVCRRRRGIQERPHFVYSEISPSSLTGIEITTAPQLSPVGFSSIDSSFDDSTSLIRQLRGLGNHIAVGDCGQATIDLRQFLSCLGLIVEEITTLTATFTLTKTISTGYRSLTVLGCTPSAFPYVSCPPSDGPNDSTNDTVVIWEKPETTENPTTNYPQYFFRD